MTYGTAGEVLRAGHWQGTPVARVVLDYEGRFLRRKRLTVEGGGDVLVDLAQTVSLEPGDGLKVASGMIEVAAATESVLRIRGDLVRLAWHIGNRHTPCQVAGDHIVIRDDHVLADMLARLGADVEAAQAPFQPEGGAYGHGRTHGHSHGSGEHAYGDDHGHDDDHGHENEHGHGHEHSHGHDH